MTRKARGVFEVDILPAQAELAGAVSRFDLKKSYRGDLEGTGEGLMLSCGDPGTGTAGYVAIETVSGSLESIEGSFALQQFGTMISGVPTLHYEVVPGSGSGGLEGIVGKLRLVIDADGTHNFELDYELPAAE